ncbi:hypothetical protein SAMN02745117_01265 [Lampropedia hyalina DSM 16112]|uniref:DUF1289 domain-containing protein n=1 Tax=Lampropedia hyalina DSM 16112 TaxID=1122156 RepID=A0A1M4YM69_9BURK|nr:DUF1289 domain-containing protein [Lampropedia hyalina]SHF06476.1 hypothetical protein SAMN02745117_01265 [Lampropedia hyalina DSM 16112]
MNRADAPAPSRALLRLAALARQRIGLAAAAPAGHSVPMLPSPCVGVCRLAESPATEPVESPLCVGCWRSLDEIMAWRDAPEAEKQRIWQAIAQRAGIPPMF